MLKKPPPAARRFVVYEGAERLSALREQWIVLEQNSHQLAFYQTWAWCSSYIEFLKNALPGACIVAGYRDDKLVAVFPLQFAEEKSCGLFLNVLRFPSYPDLYLSDVLVCDKDDSTGLLDELVAWLKTSNRFRWDLIRLQNVIWTSQVRQLVDRSIQNVLVEHEHRSALLNCASGLDKVREHITGRFWRNLCRLERKAEKQGKLEYFYSSNDRSFNDSYLQFLDIEADCWKGTANTAIQSRTDLNRFYHEFSSRLDTGRNRRIIYFLKINGKAVAGDFGVITGRTLYLLKVGYRQAWSGIGPGNLLLKRILQDCAENPDIDAISFVTASEWTRKWKTESVDTHNYYIFNNTLSGSIARVLYKAKFYLRKVRDGLKKLPEPGS